MKKILALLTVFVLLSSSFLSLGAANFDTDHQNAPPGYITFFGITEDPNNCRSGVANTAGSGDHLFGSLWDDDDYVLWSVPVETWDAQEDVYYYTITNTIDCHYMDGSFGEVRNTTYPTEMFMLRYQYDF